MTNSTDGLDIIRHFVQMREEIQLQRIRTGNRINAVTSGRADASEFFVTYMRTYYDRYNDIEASLNEQIGELSKKLAKDTPILADIQAIRGIGPILAARLLAEIDFTRANNPSSLLAYAGYAPGRDRRVKGQKIQYNQRLRVVCYLIGVSFIKSRSPYRAIYDASREMYAAKHPDWTPMHCHLASIRRMMKRFLSHLYLIGRTRAGLPVRRPYVQDYLAHVHIDAPEDYGWPVLDHNYEAVMPRVEADDEDLSDFFTFGISDADMAIIDSAAR